MKNALNTDETLRLAMTHSLDGGCKRGAVQDVPGIGSSAGNRSMENAKRKWCPGDCRRESQTVRRASTWTARRWAEGAACSPARRGSAVPDRVNTGFRYARTAHARSS